MKNLLKAAAHRFRQTGSVPGVLRGLGGQRHETGDGTLTWRERCHDRYGSLWKKGVSFDAQSETTNRVSVFDVATLPTGDLLVVAVRGSRDLWFESESQLRKKLGAACFRHEVSSALGPLDNRKSYGHESRLELWSPK